MRRGHIEAAELRELDDLGIGDDADEGVHAVTGGLQVGQDRFDVLFEEQKVRHDHVRARNGAAGLSQRMRRLGPFCGGMHADLEAGEILGQPRLGAGDGPGAVGVERDNGDMIPAHM